MRLILAIFFVITMLGLIGCVAGWLIDPRQFYHSYLAGYLFTLSLVLGMLFFVMLHHVVAAGWSTVVRRPAEQVLAALPLLGVLFVPVLIGAWIVEPHGLYKWTIIAPTEDAVLEHKQPFLALWFFTIASIVYFVVWGGISWIMRSYSLRQDERGDPRLTLSMQKWSAPGLILYAFAFTFACFHWIMSLDFHWYSTIFGVYVWSGSVVASLALLVLMTVGLSRQALRGMVSEDTLHDLGKLLFGFCVFWAYIAFSQYFLMWYANIPEETVWYLKRWEAGWRPLSVAIPVVYFLVPFVVLMSAVPKRRPVVMAVISALLLVIHYADMYWMVMPELHTAGPAWAWLWLDVSAVLFTAGAAGMVVAWAMTRHAAYPIRDPRLHEAIQEAHTHAPAEPV